MSARERPINLRGDEVSAILDGRKTVLRRVVKGAPASVCEVVPSLLANRGDLFDFRRNLDNPVAIPCPYGQPGGRLWVRETCAWSDTGPKRIDTGNPFVVYRADGEIIASLGHIQGPPVARMLWTPSTRMPRWASRLTLEVVSVRVERLHDITEEDAKAEGVKVGLRAWPPGDDPHRLACTHCGQRRSQHVGTVHACFGGQGTVFNPNTYRGGFAQAWEASKGAGSWAANPWVWRVEVRRMQP